MASIPTTTSTEQAQLSNLGSSSRGAAPPTWALGELGEPTMAGGRVIPAPRMLEAREALVTGGRGPAPPMAEVRVTRLVSGEAGQVSSLAMVTTWPPPRARHPRSVGGDLVIMGNVSLVTAQHRVTAAPGSHGDQHGHEHGRRHHEAEAEGSRGNGGEIHLSWPAQGIAIRIKTRNFKEFSNLFSFQYYFAVDNTYVTKKLMLLLFPFAHNDW